MNIHKKVNRKVQGVSQSQNPQHQEEEKNDKN